jgi:hypothetical protein
MAVVTSKAARMAVPETARARAAVRVFLQSPCFNLIFRARERNIFDRSQEALNLKKTTTSKL